MKRFMLIWTVVFLTVCLVGRACYGINENEKTVVKETEKEKKDKASFNFMGVGDNLLHDVIYAYDVDDNYDDIYEPIKEYTKKSDLNYINYETI